PREGRGEGGTGGRGNGENRRSSAPSLARRVGAPAQDAGEAALSLEKARRVVLDNGLTLLLYENRRLPLVVADAFVRNVRLLEPEDKAGVAALTGRLLEEGTGKHTGPEIAELIE